MKPLEVVFCSVNSQYVHSSLAPWCLKAGVETYADLPHRVYVCEGTINENPTSIFERIEKSDPNLLGFCCYIWNIKVVQELACRFKEKHPDCIIVFGGPEVSYNAKDVLLHNPFVDYVISGEGEQPIAQLCDALAQKQKTRINGLCFREGDAIHLSAPYVAVENPPSPYGEEYFATLQNRIAYVESTRGCPYSCAFCLSGRCGKVRYFDINQTKQDILRLANSGTKTVKFVDRTFNANKKRAKEIVKFILDHYGRDIPQGVCFHFEIAGDILDEEFLSLFAAAPIGCIQLEIGLQSFNEKTLAAIHRKTNCSILQKNIRSLIKKRNIHIHIDLIAGLPKEDYSSFSKSFNTAFSLGSDMLQLGFLKLLHGADMREKSEEFPCRFSENPPYEVLETPYLTRSDLERLHRVEDVCDRTYNSGRFRLTLQYLTDELGNDPFSVLEYIADRIEEQHRISLDEYTARLFAVLSSMDRISPAVLRDRMVCDLLASVAGAKIPICLQQQDPFLKTAKQLLARTVSTQPKKGIPRTTALLYTEQAVVYADYENRHPVTGRFRLHKIPFADLPKQAD